MATAKDDREHDKPRRTAGRHTLLGVRVSPVWYEFCDNGDTEVCYFANLHGVIYVQPRHLLSSLNSTWN